MSLNQLPCVGKDGGQRIFYFTVDAEEDSFGKFWTYRVHLCNPPQARVDDFYFARFQDFKDGTIQVVMLENHGKEYYRAKGITEALFHEIASRTGLRLFSSTNKSDKKRTDEEYRSDAATNVWNQLVAAGRARHIKEEDRYEYIPQP